MKQLVNNPTASATSESDWSRPDNRFLPIRASDLVENLAAQAEQLSLNKASVESFARALEQVIDRETGRFERQLSDSYAMFNPDRDTLPVGEPPSPEDYDEICDLLAFLLDKANFEELDDVQIAQAVMRARSRNLTVKVDPNRVEFLRLWVRGRGEAEKRERCWWRPWRWETSTVRMFKRLMVLARLKDDPHVMLKLFKDIPESDVEALLPHAEVTMTLWDRLKLFGSGAGTVGSTVSKLIGFVGGIFALWKFAWIILLGLGTLGIRSFFGYRNARLNRDWQRTRHLYFQNLGNNASALQLLVATLKQEEFKEVLLTYLFAQAPPAEESNEQPLGERIEKYLEHQFEVQVDFDIKDGEQKLQKLGLTSDESAQQVLPLEQAIETLRLLEQGTGPRMLELS